MKIPSFRTQETLPEIKKSRVPIKTLFLSTLSILLVTLGWGVYSFAARYRVQDQMQVKLKELSNQEYPENPAALSSHFKQYSNRKLTIIRKDDTHFDFVLESTDPKIAKIVIKNVDLELYIPKAPQWTKQDQGLEDIAFTDREWNRQQVSFPANSEHIEVTGGDGFEKKNIHEIALARNCLNAGLWEIILSVKDDSGNKAMYYQGWFTLPMGYYKDVFEKINDLSYWKHWWKLEHWQSPAGTFTNIDLLRKVIDEKEVVADFPLDEPIISSGEQSRKIRTLQATNLRTWRDFYENSQNVKFASFIPPGYYDQDKAWKNQYWKIGKFEKAILRNIKAVNNNPSLQEIELVFTDTKTGEQNKFLVSGVNLKSLPQLPVKNYPKGLYMPMGIGISPFYLSYEDLEKNPPYESAYFSVLLDSKNRWINHHQVAIDGAVMHRDAKQPNLLHLYLLSYERMTLVAHFLIDISAAK